MHDCGLHKGARRARVVVELADIVREHGNQLRRVQALTPDQHTVLRAVERCRTPALGGHLDVCRACGHSEPAYNSCRNRHCPKCQSLAQARWVASRLVRLLPIHYFHVVFTLPAPLRPLARRNARTVFNMLFAAASETLLELGRDARWLGAELGITAVLHTWTRELVFHPHLHCIVTGGGLTDDGQSWRSSKRDFLLPVRVMGSLFRGKILSKLARAYAGGGLDLGPRTTGKSFSAMLDGLYHTDWIVYAKRPFGGSEHVVRYLGRYTHRIGISNQRIVSCQQGQVTFRTKNGKTVTLQAVEFLARFVQHVLPTGFVKIRHYGLMAPGRVTTRLQAARQLLDQKPHADASVRLRSVPINPDRGWRELYALLTGIDLRRCPACGQIALVRQPLPSQPRAPPRAA